MRLKTRYSTHDRTLCLVENHEYTLLELYYKALFMLYKDFLKKLNLKYYHLTKEGTYLPFWPHTYNTIITWFTNKLKNKVKLPPLHCNLYHDIQGYFDIIEVDKQWLWEWQLRYNKMLAWVLDTCKNVAYNELFLKQTKNLVIQFEDERVYNSLIPNPFLSI